MRRWLIVVAGIVIACSCNRKVMRTNSVMLASEMIVRLETAAEYSDSLKAAVLLRDAQAIHHVVPLPSGGYGFSRQYLDANKSDPQFYRLIRDCNVSVLAYESLKRYVGNEMMQSVSGPGSDTIRERWNELR
ncbi:hypothetical protein [Rurimicrobium arvi]